MFLVHISAKNNVSCRWFHVVDLTDLSKVGWNLLLQSMECGIAVCEVQCLYNRVEVYVFNVFSQLVKCWALVCLGNEIVRSSETVRKRGQLVCHQLFQDQLYVTYLELQQKLKGHISLVFISVTLYLVDFGVTFLTVSAIIFSCSFLIGSKKCLNSSLLVINASFKKGRGMWMVVVGGSLHLQHI